MSGQERAKKKKILVYFIGGITYGEISAVRFLQKLHPKFRFIIATTCIVNGDSALKQFEGPQDTGLLVSETIKK